MRLVATTWPQPHLDRKLKVKVRKLLGPMTLETLLAYLAATSAFALAVFVLVREPRRLAYLAFALGMVALGFRELLGVMAMEALDEADIGRWHRYRLPATASSKNKR